MIIIMTIIRPVRKAFIATTTLSIIMTIIRPVRKAFYSDYYIEHYNDYYKAC